MHRTVYIHPLTTEVCLDSEKVAMINSHCVGNTPLIKLNPNYQDLKCTVYAKWVFNPSGSIKDRVAKQIIEDYGQKVELSLAERS